MAEEQNERGARFTWGEGDVQWHTPEEMAQIKAGLKKGESAKPSEGVKRALATWERKCLNRLKDGRSAACPFETADLDADVQALIRGGLLTADSVEEVRDVFDHALEGAAELQRMAEAPAEAPAPSDARAAIKAGWAERRLERERLHGPAAMPEDE